jgi:hypothetical protein
MKFLVERQLPDIGKCEITLEVYEENDALICAVYQLEGTIKAKPKAWLGVVRTELATLEGVAREAGCAEMRMAGRFKNSIFPDYEPFEPSSGLDGLRKRL